MSTLSKILQYDDKSYESFYDITNAAISGGIPSANQWVEDQNGSADGARARH